MLIKDTQVAENMTLSPIHEEFLTKNCTVPQDTQHLLKKYEWKSEESALTSEPNLIEILHTKIKAHPNGFFAKDLIIWYKKTFNKDLPWDWLELLRASNKFDVENVQNKIVLYSKQILVWRKLDLNRFAFKENNHPVEERPKENEHESAINFVRYKHLEKSLKSYKRVGPFYANTDN